MNLIKKFSIIIFPIIVMTLFSACSSNELQQDIYNAIYYNWEEINTFDEYSYINTLKEKSSFEINNIEEQDNVYTVTLSVTAPDIKSGVEEYQNSITSVPTDGEMNETLKSIIENADLKTTEQTVTVFVTDDGTYDVEFSSGFVDAMCGYSYQYYVNQMQKLYEGE